MLGYQFLREEESTPLEYDESVLPYPQHDLEQPEAEIIINVVTLRANVSQDGWSDVLRR
jgi:hypothetical protein